MSFGEMAIIDRAPRSALVLADTEVECDRLSLDAIQGLETRDPRIKIRLLENLAVLWIYLATVGGSGRQFAFQMIGRP
jgi:CRP-like cAMP-binding protein